MPCSGALGALILLLTLMQSTPQSASAADPWICIHSANFELYTTAGEKTGREALLVFEEIRTAFRDILGVKFPENKPVTIVAFRDEQEYAPYRVHAGAFAYYMPLPRRDLIVMQDLLPEHYPMVLHEYTHLVINQAGMKLPLWLNEGFAEMYSTLKPIGREIRVGRIIPARLQMAEAGLIDLRDILNADAHSKLYNESDRMGIFYAESWALVHMLKFSKAYSPGFERFLDDIGRGDPSDQALEKVYGKPIEAIQTDLQAYVHGEHFYEGVIHAKLGKPNVELVVMPKDALETAVMLAGIKSRGTHRAEALKTLEQLATANPGKPAPLEALAWVHLTGSDPQSATEPFRRALEAGTRDANLCFSYAVKLRAFIPGADYLAALRRATEIDPEFSAAQQLLAAYAFNTRDYREAVTRLHLVKKLDRARAFSYYRALAFAAFQIGQATEARSAANRAQQYASTDEEHRLADEITRYVTGASPPLKPPELPQ